MPEGRSHDRSADTPRRSGRRLLLAWLAVALLAGCTVPGIPNQPEPARSAPEPVRSGVLYGRVLRQDGRPATQSTVEAYQLSNADKARVGLAVVSLGFFCLLPGFCPSPVSATVNDDGGYAFPAAKIKNAPNITVTAKHAPGPGQSLGPEVVAGFDHPDGTQQRVPDLRYWEPKITVRHTGTNATVTWTALKPGADYSLWTVDTGDVAGQPQPTGIHTRGTGASVDLRPYEDKPHALIVVAQTTATAAGQTASLAYHTGSVALPAAGAPPSRGRPCLVGDPRAPLVAAAQPCPLTDGDLDTNAAVPVPCPSAASACPDPTRHRICVDLGRSRPVSLVVYRTPFLTTDTTVELSVDRVTFRTVGRPPAPDGSDIQPTRVDPPVPATLICVRDDRFGFAGASLDEISAWW